MRFITLTSLSVLLALALSTLTLAQLAADGVSQPFADRSLDSLDPSSLLTERSLLEARQSTNTTSSNSTTTSSASQPSGSVGPGGDAVLSEPGECSMDNHLSTNQQASWGNGFVNTCCGFATGSQCWYRQQNMVSGDQECEIPSCPDLESEDPTRMIGFVPLNSTNGQGKYGNIFLSLGMLSPGTMMVPAIGLTLLVAVVSVASNTIF